MYGLHAGTQNFKYINFLKSSVWSFLKEWSDSNIAVKYQKGSSAMYVIVHKCLSLMSSYGIMSSVYIDVVHILKCYIFEWYGMIWKKELFLFFFNFNV